ncbi:MAG: hypothetical protein ACREXR_20985 [Gammaproteobacteria bacterium]
MNYFLYILIVASSALLIYALLAPWKGTVWLKPEACLVLIQQGTSVQKLDDGACLWVGKFDNRFKGVKLYIGKQFIVPHHQVVAYEIKD